MQCLLLLYFVLQTLQCDRVTAFGVHPTFLPKANGLGRWLPLNTCAASVHCCFHSHTNRSVALAASSASGSNSEEELSSNTLKIHGLVDNLEQACRVDATIRELQQQVPRLLTKPLTAITADRVYKKDCPLVVVVDVGGSPDATTGPRPSDDIYFNNQEEEDGRRSSRIQEITLTKTREELVSLSDVIVLGTTATRQANNAWTAADSSTSSTSSSVDCQLWLDPSLELIQIPWNCSIPVLGSSSRTNQLKGFSEIKLDLETGKIQKHSILNVTFNGTPMNGPTIGQAIISWQAAVTNIQQSPLVQSFLSPAATSIFTELRDGLLEQAAEVAARQTGGDAGSDKTAPIPHVFVVPASARKLDQDADITLDSLWINNTKILSKEDGAMPYPGSDEWDRYVTAHEYLATFCDTVIPMLSSGSSSSSAATTGDVVRLFANDVRLTSSIITKMDDEQERDHSGSATLLLGKEDVSSYYTSLALARKGTGGMWSLTNVAVDWKSATASIDYVATISNVPLQQPWTILGRDVYYLQGSDDDAGATLDGDPLIQRIHQVEFSVSSGGMTLDNQFVMKNLVRAIKQGGRRLGLGSGRDILSDLLFRQVANGAVGGGIGSSLETKDESTGQSSSSVMTPVRGQRRRISESSAAKIYFLLSDLHDQIDNLLSVTIDERISPPAIDYMAETIELKGYLGETILRGNMLYQRVVGSMLSTLRQAIVQKTVIVVKSPPKRVIEFTRAGAIRTSLTLQLRLKSPITAIGQGVSGGLVPEDIVSPPLTLELISDYVLDRRTGQIEQHKLVESRVNGQLTPGDVLSRSIQRFLNLDESDGDDLLLRPLSDALTWFRSIAGGSVTGGGGNESSR